MYRNFFEDRRMELLNQAIQEDEAGNYIKAFLLYMNALEYFKTQLKYERNPETKEAVTAKYDEYLRRAEELRAVLEAGGGQRPVPVIAVRFPRH